MGADVPHERVAERGPRQQEEPDRGQEPAVERAAEDVAEQPHADQRDARPDQGEKSGEAGHGVESDYGSTRSSAICVDVSSNSISKIPSIVALNEIGVTTPALTSCMML